MKKYRIKRKIYTSDSDRATYLMERGYKLVSMSYWLYSASPVVSYVLQDKWF